ncbi:hypothetical protein JKP88DRAFT_298096 [Tribonema minus]|uniref:C2 domain-containing protein n=1 Tax=Tribonema minus TaxID=303371 RepID=A0A836CMG6_9STRA|nr:hypothetical protein JKP88DRAFT_298096 [Tribonema minus]
MVVTGAETVGWLQSEASAAFSRAHVCASHQIQVIGLYATVKSGEARPLDAASDALACAAQFLPPGSAGPVRLQGRLMVKVCIDPNGPVGIVLDSKAKDCAIVKALVAAPPDSAQRSSAQRSMSLAPATKKKFMSRFTGGAGGGKDDSAAEKAAAAALAQPLLGSDAVEEGMLVSRIEAHLGAGRTLEHDTISLSAAETRSLLRPLQHLRRAVTFVDPPPEGAAADAAEDGRQALYTVSIEVVRAENLRVADVFSSDPYCQLRLAGMSRRTAVRKTTTSPAWHETFVFPLLSLEWELLCELWDENFGKDDSLGEVRIDMRTLPVNRAVTSTSSTGPGGKGPPPLPPRERIEWQPVENGKGRLKLRIHIQENVSLQVVPIKPIWPKSAPESSPISLEDIFLQPAAAPTTSTKGKKSGANSATSPSATSTDPPTSLLYPGTVAFLKRFGGSSNGSSGGGGSVYKAAGGASPAVEASRHFRQLRYPSEWNAAGAAAGQGGEGYAPARVEIRGGRTEELPTALGSLSVGAAAVPRDAYDLVGGNAPPPLLCALPLASTDTIFALSLIILAARGARPQAVPFSTAALTLVMEAAANASHRLCLGDAYSYWRWAAALAFACSGVEPPLAGGTGTALQGTVLDVRPSGKATSAGTAECAIEDGVVRWQREGRTTGGGVGQAELADVTAVELTHDHMRAKRYVFNITVVTGQDLLVGGIHSSSQRASITGGGTALKPYCRVAVGSDARCTRAYTMEGRAISWNRDKMLGDAFVPFSSLEPGQEYTETVKLSERFRHLRLALVCATGLPSNDVLGEAMISITEFEERPGVPLEVPLRVCAGVDVAKLKKLGLKEVKDGSGGAALALGTVTVILSETDATESVLKRKPSSPAAASAQATVTVRCTLREADELSAAWPVKLLEHQSGELCTELPPVDARGISCYSMVVGLNALNLARIAQEDERPAEKAIAGAAVDTSPFCKGLLPARAGDVGSSGAGEPLSFDISEMRVEVWENQRKQPLLGWGSGKRRHLTPGDPRRYTDASGGSRIKALAMLAAPPGYMYSGDWVEGKWQYGTDSFAELAKEIAKGTSCPEKRGSHGEDSSDDEGWGGAIGSGGGGMEPAVKIGLNDVLRLVAISPSTLAIEVLLRKTAFGSPAVSNNGNSSATAAGSRVATIIVGPCWADRLGSLVMERRSMCCAREALTSVLTHIG